MRQTINSMTASDYIVNNFFEPTECSLTNEAIQDYKRLIEYTDDVVFRNNDEANFFFNTLSRTYASILFSIYNNAIKDEIKYSMDLAHINLLAVMNRLLTHKVSLEPMTKLFLEDLVKLIYRDEYRSLNHYGLLLGRAIGSYAVSNKATVELDISTGYRHNRNGKIPTVTDELQMLLAKVGTLKTLDIIKCLMGVNINIYYFHNRHKLDELLNKYTATLRTHATALPKAP